MVGRDECVGLCVERLGVDVAMEVEKHVGKEDVGTQAVLAFFRSRVNGKSVVTFGRLEVTAFSFDIGNGDENLVTIVGVLVLSKYLMQFVESCLCVDVAQRFVLIDLGIESEGVGGTASCRFLVSLDGLHAIAVHLLVELSKDVVVACALSSITFLLCRRLKGIGGFGDVVHSQSHIGKGGKDKRLELSWSVIASGCFNDIFGIIEPIEFEIGARQSRIGSNDGIGFFGEVLCHVGESRHGSKVFALFKLCIAEQEPNARHARVVFFLAHERLPFRVVATLGVVFWFFANGVDVLCLLRLFNGSLHIGEHK